MQEREVVHGHHLRGGGARRGEHEIGVVEQVAAKVTRVKPGDFVTATVRRPGGSIYDRIGTYDMTSEETYYERGINLLHGYMTEYICDDEEYVVKVPPGLKHLHVSTPMPGTVRSRILSKSA